MAVKCWSLRRLMNVTVSPTVAIPASSQKKSSQKISLRRGQKMDRELVAHVRAFRQHMQENFKFRAQKLKVLNPPPRSPAHILIRQGR